MAINNQTEPAPLTLQTRRVKRHWWIGTTDGAAFFGQSAGELESKFNAWRAKQYSQRLNASRIAEALLNYAL